MNILHLKGKHIVAEVVLKKDRVKSIVKVDTKMLARTTVMGYTGAMMAGSDYNGPHAANGIALMFMATGQGEADEVKPHSGLLSHEF